MHCFMRQMYHYMYMGTQMQTWAGSVSDRRSTSGFMFSFGSAAVTWSSKKQPTVALSSIEAEYQGAAVAACEVAWLCKLLADLGLHVERKIVIYCDNLSSIQLARNPIFHAGPNTLRSTTISFESTC